MFCTTIGWRVNDRLSLPLPTRLREGLQRRTFADLDSGRIKRFPAREIIRQIASNLGLAALTRHETGWASIDAVYGALDRQVARLIRTGGVDAAAVYAYEDGALRLFEAAAGAGLRRFYELPIGYWRAGQKILMEERERKPEWAATLDGLRNSATKLQRKDDELAAADHIIVPSDFVRETLRMHPGMTATIDVVPYGAPPARRAPDRAVGRHASKLRLLFIGQLTQRKGVAYLFEAMRRLESVATLTLVGPRPAVGCAALSAELARHEYLGTMPHDRVLEIIARYDLLVFPSLFEGFALVILEAMAQGLPVITTPNSGASSAVEDGGNGFIVPIRDSDAIVDRVVQLAGDRDRLATMSVAALRKAEQMSWPAQGNLFIDVLRRRMVAARSSAGGT